MEYTISYREICYLVNSSWHSVCSALLPKLLTATNAAMNIYSSCLCVHPLNHNHDRKEALCVTQFQFYYVPISIHYSFSIRYWDATTLSACQTLACTPVSRSVHCKLALTNATQHTSDVSLLQASVKPCCDLPKQSTFPLLLLCLLYTNSSPHTTISHP